MFLIQEKYVLLSIVARGSRGAVAPPGPIYRVFPTMSNYNEGCMVTILLCQSILKAKFLDAASHIRYIIYNIVDSICLL